MIEKLGLMTVAPNAGALLAEELRAAGKCREKRLRCAANSTDVRYRSRFNCNRCPHEPNDQRKHHEYQVKTFN